MSVAQNVSGNWNVTVKTPMGDQSGTFAITVDGDRFTGTLSSPMLGALEADDGKVDGQTLTWRMAMTKPMPMTLEGEATVDGDTISGKLVAGAFGAFALSGTRG